MTREEAIKLLKQYQGYEPMFPDGETLKHAFDLTDETVDTLLTSLRGPTREMVERMFPGCRYCKEGIYSDFAYDKMCRSEDGIYCKFCGKPMTDEAVDMMPKRWKEALE